MSSVSSLSPSSLTSTNTPPITLSGLVSGLNTDSVIQGLLAVEKAKITNVTNQETTVQGQQTAYKQLEAKLLTLQGDVQQLDDPRQSVFAARSATSSNTSALTAAASSSAAPGVYNLRVNSIAQAQELASQGFDSAGSAITQGTFQLQVGNGSATNITIDSTNDTLQGLASAINSSGAAVTATVVNDGSTNQPYRLLLTSQTTGLAGAVTITNNLGASADAATKPVFDSNSIGSANLSSGYTGTSTPTANTGAGSYTGTSNDTYTFTVTQGGTVGSDSVITLSYKNADGSRTGSISLATGDVDTLKAVDQGLQLQFSAGTLVQGQTFSVKTYVPTVQAAQDASLTLGSGSGALTLTSSTNQVNNVIPGVTLQLQNGSAGSAVSVTVAADTTKIQTAVQNFVSDYNSVMSLIGQDVQYDAGSGTAGPLLGDSRVTHIQDQLRNMVHSVMPGLNPAMSQIGSLGITADQNGQLQIDSTKLSDALNGNLAGVTLNDIQKLFGTSGSSPHAGVQYVWSNYQTQASAAPYTLNITQAATQASITASSALASQIDIGDSNNTLALALDGANASVTLADGSYTQTALLQLIQSAVNSNTALAGHQISVGLQNGKLTFTSAAFGSASRITVNGGSANVALGLAGTENSQGQDVAGNFVVNGVTEAALGTGQFLAGSPSNAHTANLSVRVTLTPDQVGSGAQTTVSVTRGIASQLDTLLNGLTDPYTGQLKSIDDTFNQQIASLDTEKSQLTTAMQQKQAQLQTEFANMENTLAQLQAASNAVAGLNSSLTGTTTSSSSSASSAPRPSTSSSSGSSSSSTG